MCQKNEYTTLKEARTAAVGLNMRTRFRFYGYKCQECDGYHIATINKHSLPKPIKGKPEKETFHRKVCQPSNIEPGAKKVYKPEKVIVNTGKLLTVDQANFLKRLIESKAV